MDIKSEIKQNKFASNYEMALINVIFSAQRINDKTNAALKKYGILRQHYNVLRIINGRAGKPVRPGEILEVMIDKGRDLTRLVDKLEKIGFVRREKLATNKRIMLIYMTDHGAKALAAISKDVTDAILSDPKLNEKEALQLSGLLDRIRD